MNRQEAMRLNRQEAVLLELGFTRDEAEALRRISMTLRRWHERECGTDSGCIEREEETGRPYWSASWGSCGHVRRYVPDRETGARKRLAKILEDRNQRRGYGVNGAPDECVQAYVQGDPRGAALYILRPGDVPEGKSADSCYTNGIAVY